MSEEDWMKTIEFSDLDEKSKDKLIREFRDKIQNLEKKLEEKKSWDELHYKDARMVFKEKDIEKLNERIEKLKASSTSHTGLKLKGDQNFDEIRDLYEELTKLKEQTEANRQAIDIINNLTYPKENREVLRELFTWKIDKSDDAIESMESGRVDDLVDFIKRDLKFYKSLLDKLGGEKSVEDISEIGKDSPQQSDSNPPRCFMGDCKDLECEDIEAQQGIWGKCHEYKPKEKPSDYIDGEEYIKMTISEQWDRDQAIDIMNNLTYPKENREVLRELLDALYEHNASRLNAFQFRKIIIQLHKKLDGDKAGSARQTECRKCEFLKNKSYCWDCDDYKHFKPIEIEKPSEHPKTWINDKYVLVEKEDLERLKDYKISTLTEFLKIYLPEEKEKPSEERIIRQDIIDRYEKNHDKGKISISEVIEDLKALPYDEDNHSIVEEYIHRLVLKYEKRLK